MRQSCRSRWAVGFLFGLCLGGVKAPAQTNAAPLLAQLNQAVSGGKAINRVTLKGNAVWHAGSLEDSGPVTLTASSSGTAQLQLMLSTLGSKTESQSGLGFAQSCSWTGANGASKNINLRNCWRPFVLFFPAISLQMGLTPKSLGLADLGIGTVGTGTYRHLQGQFVFSDLPMREVADVMAASTSDLGLDPTTLLPQVLDYTLEPDSGGSSNPVAVEIRYLNYTAVDGVRVPFEIQRYVNGCLQLDITVTSAQIN